MRNRIYAKSVALLLASTLLLSAAIGNIRSVSAQEVQTNASQQPDINISDLTWKSAVAGWGTTQLNKSIDGNPLNVAGKSYSNGIGTHANSKIVYDLYPTYSRFVAVAGIDTDINSNPDSVKAKVKFIVKVDGVDLASSPEVLKNGSYTFDVPIPAGSKQLTLVVDSVGEITCDHGDWVDAGFILDSTHGTPNESQPVEVSSPNGKVTGLVKQSSGKLVYSVNMAGKPVIEESNLGILADGMDIGNKVELGTPERSAPAQESYPWTGVHSIAQDLHTLTKIPITNVITGLQYTLEVKMFDDGIAFRYVIPEGTSARNISGESTSFKVPAGSQVWYSTNITSYESKYTKANAELVPVGTQIAPPLTFKLLDNLGYASITEGALVNYAGMSLIASGNQTFKANFQNNGSWSLSGQIETPWRIVMLSPDLNGLVNNDIISNVSAPPSDSYKDADWIHPGSSTWSWLGGGGVTVDNMKLYMDYASELGIPYNLVDEGWQSWSSSSGTYWDALKDVIDYGKQKNVATWVWKAAPDRNGIKGIYDQTARRELFQKLHDLGVVGVKIDFIDGEEMFKMNFYRDTLIDATEFHLMVDFHGANKPTGLSRTYPNELSREAVYGLEQGAPPADFNATLPFTRYLAGHGDYTPLSFSGHMGNSSWSNQLATALTFTSPYMVFGEHPQKMIVNPAVELIKSMPSTWDETIVLPESEIGQVSALARRHGTTWYVAVINGLDSRSMKFNLSFLGDGSYQAAIYGDDLMKQQGYSLASKNVNKYTELTADMRSSGGYVAKFSKLDMEPYGGGFVDSKKVVLHATSPQSEIHYTLDGSEPTVNSPKYANYIQITGTSTLRAKILAGDGSGTDISARFNQTSPYLEITYDGNGDKVDKGGKVHFQTNAEGSNYDIRYTLDGSEPDRQSLLYTAPFSFASSRAVIKAKLFIEGHDAVSAEKKLFSVEHMLPTPSLPDVYLNDLTWVSATTGFSSIKLNKSIDGNPLTVAGQVYGKGIGTHAPSDIVYNIVPGAKRFVAVAGVDNEVNKDGQGSIIFKVYVDGVLMSDSPVMGNNEFWNFNVKLPENAKQIKLTLDDYDGKNFDHGDWVNAGFLYSTSIHPAATLYVDPNSVPAGQTFDVQYGLTDISDSYLAQDLTVKYDPEQLEFVSVSSLQEGFIVSDHKQVDAGTIRVIAFSEGTSHAVHTDGDVLKFTFKSRQLTQGSSAAILVQNIVLAKADGSEYDVPGAEGHVLITVINKANLQAAIASAQQAYDAAIEGSAPGQYPVGSKAVLQAAINKAQAVVNNEQAGQDQVEQAAAELQEALQSFLSSVHTSSPGDVNNDGKYSIGDLAIVAAAYGRTSDDPNWNQFKQSDLNLDGKIDLLDLVIVAQQIIQ
ncbi:NPCBM/NEW2 domain-containing protein [Paenibacillus aceris]|uniref:Dockerin domain-containing protein n=1 Tax=Paenibacillus aceris TaxID=869555 RepID=A0ABS4HZW4_9BACL|nr:NPCBM/NEW2 domain-containing protein [Paenibacillus aceris]MBP1964095.1 hypothetical protein [Paenibacillus aceris]